MTTAYVYDPRYLDHASLGGEHPERPMRLVAILDTLASGGALDKMTALPATEITDRDLLRVHTPGHVALLREMSARGGGTIDADTYVAQASYEVARLAAGGCLTATDAVIDGKARNAFALIRPPGHHAFADRAEGFCLFNNVALAAKHALMRGLHRVAIVDFDVHHGNGTQAIFYDDPDVLYISTHQWPLYPGTGHWREIGAGAGRGATINIPLPPGVGDNGFSVVWEQVIHPALQRFRPDILFISAGFDAHWRDPLAMLQLSITGIATLAQRLVKFANDNCHGQVVAILEGGYDLDALGYGSLAVARALLADPTITDPFGPATYPEEDATQLILALRRLHQLETDDWGHWM